MTGGEDAAEAPGPARHLEVERKFDVIESTVSPSFEGIATVVRVEQSPTSSSTQCTSTHRRDLARNQITLRRRTGGDAATKLPAGPDSRTRCEHRCPLRRCWPAELLDVVLAIVRDQPVQPVARIAHFAKAQVLYGAGATALANSATTDAAWSAGALRRWCSRGQRPAERQ